MSKHAKKENTAADAVRHLNNLAARFNDSSVHPESAAKLVEAVAHFIERQEADKQALQEDLDSVVQWAGTVQKLLVRAQQLQAESGANGKARSAAAKGNIDEALSILNRLKDPIFAASRTKKHDAVKLAQDLAKAVEELPSVTYNTPNGPVKYVITGKGRVIPVPAIKDKGPKH